MEVFVQSLQDETVTHEQAHDAAPAPWLPASECGW